MKARRVGFGLILTAWVAGMVIFGPDVLWGVYHLIISLAYPYG